MFLASGEIGSVVPVTGLPCGLTEQAVAAARGIKFEPGQRNGVPISMTKLVEYSFSLFFHESDAMLAQKAEILEMPLPSQPQDESELKKLAGKVTVSIVLNPDGTASPLQNTLRCIRRFRSKIKSYRR